MGTTVENKGIEVLDKIYEASLNGLPAISKDIEDFSSDYIKQCNGNKTKAVKALVRNQKSKLASSGFLTGLGGLITLPISIPADITTSWYVQLRMIAAIAYINGYDIHSDAVKTLAYSTLVGIKVSDIIKQTGLKYSEKVTMSALKKLPGNILIKINQKLGFRFITKFGEKGLINLFKIVPVVPGVINLIWNTVETQHVASRAISQFSIENVEDRIV